MAFGTRSKLSDNWTKKQQKICKKHTKRCCYLLNDIFVFRPDEQRLKYILMNIYQRHPQAAPPVEFPGTIIEFIEEQK